MKNIIISIISLILIFICNGPAYSYNMPETVSENNSPKGAPVISEGNYNLVSVNLLSLNFSMDNQKGFVIETKKEKNLIANAGIEMSVGIASGLLCALLLGYSGFLLGSNNSNQTKQTPGIDLKPGIFMLLGGFSGYTVGSSIGLYTSGQIIGENGNYWFSLLGDFVASLFSLILTASSQIISANYTLTVILYVLLSAGGAVLSYNLTNTQNAVN